MKRVVTGWDHIFGPWLMEQTGGDYVPGRGSTIGLFETDSGRVLGSCLYSDCNGASVLMHCAGVSRKWLNREFLWYSFHYPFNELGVYKIISPVESWNTHCRRFIENLGFTREATLAGASPKGDLLLYTLTRENCKWLQRGKRSHGEAKGA